MKTLILAGGLGTRLAEETDFVPKPMVKIGEIPKSPFPFQPQTQNGKKVETNCVINITTKQLQYQPLLTVI